MPILVRDERANGASARTAAGRPTSAPAVRRASAASYIGSRVGGDSPSKELKSSPSVETLASTRVLSSRTSLLSTPRDRSQPRSSPRSTATTIVKSPPSSNRRVSTARDSRRSASAARPKSARPPSSARAHTPSHDQNVHAGPAAKDRVVVAVRKRPAKEGEKDVVIVQDGRVLKVAEPRTKVDLTKYIEFHKFEFHEAFDDNCSNEFIYHSQVQAKFTRPVNPCRRWMLSPLPPHTHTTQSPAPPHYNRDVRCCPLQVQPVVDFVVKGGHGTCFAFGQTGSGKTFTMLGGQSSPGLMTLGAEELLERWSADAAGSAADKPQLAAVELAANMRQHVSVSMLEIYGDEVYDLLHPHARAKLIPREDASRKVRIQGLTRKLVSTPEEFRKQVDLGAARRCTATTGVNESSSRSHAICELTLHLPVAGGVAAEEVGREWGKCRFVDLAGSEKGADSADQDRVTRSEGAEINKSLLALKECIRAMHDPSSTFTPFRGSKLTLVRCLAAPSGMQRLGRGAQGRGSGVEEGFSEGLSEQGFSEGLSGVEQGFSEGLS
jgi:kinesin family protein 2/24